MTLRRLLLTAIPALLLWPLRQLTWGPALASGSWWPGLNGPQLRLLAAMILAGQVAAVVTIGIRRLSLATAAGTTGLALVLGLRGSDWGLTDATPPLRVISAVLAAGLVISFLAAASVHVGLASLARAWAIWSGAPRMRDRLPALVPIAGVLVVMLALTASPDLTQLLGSGVGLRPATSAATLLPGPNSPTRPGSGRIVRDAFYSLAMKDTRVFDVYLPPSYDLVQAQHRSYPVLYLLHGDNGSVDDWVSIGLRGIVDARIAQGSLPELIVIMPDGSSPTNDETDWANRWDGTEPVEDQVIELVGEVDGTYRTLPDRSFRFIGGLSSGGFGALNIALHHADFFSVTMSFSGFASASDAAVDPGVFGTNPTYIARNSPVVQVRSVPEAGDLYYVLSAGEHDLYFQARMRDFAHQLATLGYPYEFHVVPGGHDGAAWGAGLALGLDYVGRVVSRRPEPTPARQ